MNRNPLGLLALFLTLAIVAGCGVPPQSRLGAEEGEKAGEKRLMALRIERWGETRFSGLLALQVGDDRLRYALLDASGVKLLEARSDSSGESQVLHAKGVIRDSGLADFLGQALVRVFFMEPVTSPCSGGWWNRLCRENRTAKGQHIGPLPWWRIEVSTNSAGEETIVYLQPWIGVRLSLRALSGGALP